MGSQKIVKFKVRKIDSHEKITYTFISFWFFTGACTIHDDHNRSSGANLHGCNRTRCGVYHYEH